MRKTAAGARLSFIPPMLPTLVDEPPEGDDWIHEIKYDGYRTQIVIDRGIVTVYTRNGHDWTAKLRPLAEAAAELPADDLILDGEMIVTGTNGKPDFGALKGAIRGAPERLSFVAFDMLHLDGEDIRSWPLFQRRDHMWSVIKPALGKIQYSHHVDDVSGADFFAAADAMELEGIVSKRADSTYASGRTRHWLKTKSYQTSELEVAGVLREPGKPTMVLMATPGERKYVGGAFISLNKQMRERLWKRVEEARGKPLAGVDKPAAQWVRPGLVGQVKHLRGEETLRHAQLEKIREKR